MPVRNTSTPATAARSHHKKTDPATDTADQTPAASDQADASPPAHAKRSRTPAADPTPDAPAEQPPASPTHPRRRTPTPPAGGDGASTEPPASSGHPLQDQAKNAVGKAKQAMPDQEPQPQVPCPLCDTGGQVVVHPMPESGPQPILDAINGAKQEIDLEIYQMNDPTVTQALIDAAKRGVKVRVMLEPKTVGGNTYKAVSANLAAHGIDVQATPPQFDSSHNVDHAKFMVVDNKDMLFGTGNLDSSGLGRGDKYNNRDFWTNDSRPETVSEAGQLFNADWNRQPTTGIDFKNMVVTPDNADGKILGLIDGAQKRLYVYNQELFDPTVNQHIIQAKQRGVDVQVIAGNPKKFFGEGGTDKNALALAQFKQAGIPGTELTSLYVHGKGIVADDKTYLGSQNFSTGGLKTNREVGEIFDDPNNADKVAATYPGYMKKG
jgi:cardiolipin synthase